MIQIDNLTFSYKKKANPVLADFSLNIDAGGIYGLLGKNGVGKSTLLYLIAGLLTPSMGSVSYNGIDTRRRSVQTLREIFLVPEEFNLPNLPLNEYVRINSRFYPKFSMQDFKTNLETFGLDPDMRLGSISMGQKKKAFLCFALATNTSLILLDEPTNGLDIPGKSRFRKFIVSAMDPDRTVIISTHQVRDIDRILDHVIITDNHGVVLDKSVSEILQHLKFITSDSKQLIDRALFVTPSVAGSEIILPNDDDEETPLNIESLFEFALNNPGALQSVFNSKSEQL